MVLVLVRSGIFGWKDKGRGARYEGNRGPTRTRGPRLPLTNSQDWAKRHFQRQITNRRQAHSIPSVFLVSVSHGLVSTPTARPNNPRQQIHLRRRLLSQEINVNCASGFIIYYNPTQNPTVQEQLETLSLFQTVPS